MTPSIESVSPAAVGAAGGELVRITGTGIAPQVTVLFGAVAGEVIGVVPSGGRVLVDVRAPAGEAGDAPLSVQNLDSDGAPIAGEVAAVVRSRRASCTTTSNCCRMAIFRSS